MPCVYLPGPAPAVTVANTSEEVKIEELEPQKTHRKLSNSTSYIPYVIWNVPREQKLIFEDAMFMHWRNVPRICKEAHVPLCQLW
jgi:hypothetical protein